MTQYVAVQFSPADQRRYTYHNDGEPVAIGDLVEVETKDGRKRVTVAGLPESKPNFETKPILGRAEERGDAETAVRNDESPPPAGHNMPPPYDAGAVEAFEAKVREHADAAGAWLDEGDLTSEEEAERLADLLSGARTLLKQIEDRRKAEKQPHLDASRAVDSAFKRLTDPLSRTMEKVKPLLTAWATKKREAEEARRRAEIEAARKAEEEAQKAREAAAARNDTMGEAEAEERARAAKKAEEDAARRKTTGAVHSASGGGRTTSLRTYRTAKVVNVRRAFMALEQEHGAEIAECLERIANAKIRAAKGRPIEIAGVEIHEEQRVA